MHVYQSDLLTILCVAVNAFMSGHRLFSMLNKSVFCYWVGVGECVILFLATMTIMTHSWLFMRITLSIYMYYIPHCGVLGNYGNIRATKFIFGDTPQSRSIDL